MRIKVGHNPGAYYAPIYLAIARGYYAEEGFELELETFTSGEATIPSLATGQIDAAGIGLSAALYGAVARGVELKIVAGCSRNEPGYSSSALTVRKDLIDSGAVRDVADLRGRTIGSISQTVGLTIDLSRALQGAGLSDNDINLTVLSFPDQVPALANGAIDAGMLSEPFVAVATGQGYAVRWKGADELYPNHQLTAFGFAPSFARDQVDVGQRFVAATLRGARDFVDAVKHNRDRPGLYAVLAEYTPLKDLAMYERIVPSGIDPDGEINLDSMEYDQSWLIERGHLRERVDLAQVVDLRYRDAALQRLGRYTPRP
jgi:NitT/TauT family transport system substrate-binding protein